MFTVALVVLAVLGVWALASVGLAFLAGGVIRNREERDVRCATAPRLAHL